MKDWKSYLDPRFFNGICHRGLHDETKTENGMNAFKAAIEKDKAFEFDIHLTKDNQFVVMHDHDLERVTGKKGIVEELTLEEIKREHKLLDGEEIPSLDELLKENDGRVPMVIELKSHGDAKEARRLGKEAAKYLKGRVDPHKAMVISFDPRTLQAFGKKAGIHRALLVCLEKKWTLMFRNFFESLDMDGRMVADPKVVKYRKKGRLINCWTIRNTADRDAVKPYVDMITYELFDYDK